MASVSAALAAHFVGPVTTLAACWRITRRDGREFFFTEHDRDLPFEGNVCKAGSGHSRTAIANDANLSVDNPDVVRCLRQRLDHGRRAARRSVRSGGGADLPGQQGGPRHGRRSHTASGKALFAAWRPAKGPRHVGGRPARVELDVLRDRQRQVAGDPAVIETDGGREHPRLDVGRNGITSCAGASRQRP